MDVWEKYVGKKVFLRTNNHRTYSGIIKEVVGVGDGLIFISLVTTHQSKWVTVAAHEIVEIKEED